MRIEVSGKGFVNAITAIRGAVASRSPKPAMQRIKVAAAADGRVRLTATDGSLLAAVDVADGVTAVADGTCLIEPAKAVEFLKACGHEGVLLADEKAVEWRGPGGMPRNRGAVIDVNEFPGDGEAVPDGGVTLPAGTWRAMVGAVMPSLGEWDEGWADRENGHKGKFEVECVLLSIKGRSLRVEATNMSNLSRAWHPLADGDGCEVATAMVPTEAVRLLLRLADGPVRGVWTKNMVHFVGAGFRLSSSLRAGTFPNLDYAVPKSYAAKVRVPWADVQRAVAVASLAAEKGRERAKVTLAAGRLTFSVQGYNGAGDGEVACEYDGDQFEWEVSAPAVCGLLKAMAGVGDVTVGLSKSLASMVIEAPDANVLSLAACMGD